MSFWRLGVRSISALDISVGINNCRFFPRFAQITPFTALLFAFQSRMLPSLGLLPGLLIELLGPIERHRRLFILHFLCTRPPGGCNETSTSRRERSAPSEEDTKMTLREQRGRPRRKAFLRASGSFGSFQPVKRTQFAPSVFWFFSACEKNRRPAMEVCSGSMPHSGALCFLYCGCNYRTFSVIL